MDKYLKNCLAFLDASPSPFHAVKTAAERLEAYGYKNLPETDVWKLEPAGRYYTTRNGSSVIAWRMPSSKVTGWRASLVHSDNPSFRISKEKTEDPRFGRARIEEYGGPRYATWMDRPLKIAGRLFVRTENGIAQKLVETGPVLEIPTLCCHFDREGRFGSKMNMSADMQPITGEAGTDVLSLFVKEGDIAGYDLNLALCEKASVVGVNGEFFMSQRIDDLAAASATLDGFLTAGEESAKNIMADMRCDLWCMFDNEEVGSSTRQGAASMFLPDVMARIEAAAGMNAEESIRAKATSLFLSADNGHATHPNHPELSDPAHPIEMNKGVVVKLTANQKYTTTAQTATLFLEICRRADVPTQIFYNKPDVLGGGTLGAILSQKVSVPMVDIGLPQLSMHSAMETAGTKDVRYMVEAVNAFYGTVLTETADGVWEIR